MRKLLIVVGTVLAAAAAYAQSNLPTRTFTYDASQATNGLSTYEVDNTTVYSNATAGTDTTNAVSSPTTTGASFTANTIIHVLTYVYVSGNFGGTFTIHGAGSATDETQRNDVEVRSNRPLQFSTSAFTTLLNADTTSAATVGSINYGLAIFSDYPATLTQIGSTISGVDTAFNTQNVSFALSDLPTDGKVTLRLTRTLSLTQLAAGATDYNATGTIAVAIN